MSRVKRGTITNKKHKKILNSVKGYYGSRSRTYKTAKQAYIKSGQYAFNHRKMKKRIFRVQWIKIINSALFQYNISYSQFIYKLRSKNIFLDRKILSDLASNHIEIFKKICSIIKT